MKPRALDLFCGAGGAARGLQFAGFDVTGVDIKRQPRYAGDRFILGDALNPPVRLADFDLIWASPPCQGYSRMRCLPWLRDREYPMLIPAVREMLVASGAEYAIENVEGAPLNGVALRGEMFGLPFRRQRRFETSFFVMAPAPAPAPASKGVPGRMLGNRLRDQHERLNRWADQGPVGCGHQPGDARPWMGVTWMSRKEATQAIPPAYSEHIGRYAMIALGRIAA